MKTDTYDMSTFVATAPLQLRSDLHRCKFPGQKL